MNLRNLDRPVPGDGEMPPPPAPRVRQRERRAVGPLAVVVAVVAVIAVTAGVLARHHEDGPSATAPARASQAGSASAALSSTPPSPATTSASPSVTPDPDRAALDVARAFVRAWRTEGKGRRSALEPVASRRLANTLADVDPGEVPEPAGDVVLEGHAPQGTVIRLPLRDGSTAVLLVADDRGALRVIGLSQRKPS